MAIVKNQNSKLNAQLVSSYPVDRVPKSIQCILYGVDKPSSTPINGHISFFPVNKPEQVTSLRLSTFNLLGATLKPLFEFSTEGSLMIYEKATADNFITFKIKNPVDIDNGKAIEFEVESLLTGNTISIFKSNSQVCIALYPAPTAEALTSVDGGYYG